MTVGQSALLPVLLSKMLANDASVPPGLSCLRQVLA